jgi:hypothetical protein
MTFDELFDALDLDSDGELSRAELHTAARHLGWHWPQAPLYAVLDRMTVRGPLARNAFARYMAQIAEDPHGPFGEVLTSFSRVPTSGDSIAFSPSRAAGQITVTGDPAHLASRPDRGGREEVHSLLHRLVGPEAADDYDTLLGELSAEPGQVSGADSALLIIDPQRSFTGGTWMHSVGAGRDLEVGPLRMAFGNCGRLLADCGERIEKMFTRCPFPPDSYDWDERVAPLIDASQTYFVKPGNSVLWPPTNGFREWVADLIDRGKRTLVMGGCTLNSCIRVSAIDTQQLFVSQNLRVAVDLSLSGARMSNYLRSDLHGGMSPVESALRQLAAAKIRLMPHAEWT